MLLNPYLPNEILDPDWGEQTTSSEDSSAMAVNTGAHPNQGSGGALVRVHDGTHFALVVIGPL